MFTARLGRAFLSKAKEITGTPYADALTGSRKDDLISGLGGNDTLNGGAGNDTLIGGSGNDLLRGGKGDDVFRYDDRSFGNDTIEGFSKGDSIDLRALNVADLATLKPYMQETPDGVLITLGYNSNAESIFLDGVTLKSLSAQNFVFNASNKDLTVTGTSVYRDVLFGGNGDDRLEGLSGDDQLNGGAGNDTLIGGSGADILRGGKGADTFRFDYMPQSSSSGDTVVDFSHRDDTFELVSSVFTELKKGELSNGAFREGVAALDASDRIIYDRSTGTLLYDPDGVGGEAAVKIATLTNHEKLDASDFLVV